MDTDALLRTIPHLSADERAAITKGVALLDESQSDWYQHIALARLEMGSGARCVLGQLYGDYDRGKQELGIYDDWGGDWGFDAHLYDDGSIAPMIADHAYDRLDAAWSAIITARRNADAAVASR